MDDRQEKNLEFYNLDKLLKYDCHYNLIIGERSNGKTYACLKKSLEIYKESGKQSAYLRRWKEDFRGKRGETLFDALLYNEEVIKIFEGEWTGIKYYSGKWYLTKYDKVLDKYIQDVKPFMYGFSLSDMEHDKSTSYPEIVFIIFDEFLTRGMYLNNEFVLFCNVLSTIIRHRDDVKADHLVVVRKLEHRIPLAFRMVMDDTPMNDSCLTLTDRFPLRHCGFYVFRSTAREHVCEQDGSKQQKTTMYIKLHLRPFIIFQMNRRSDRAASPRPYPPDTIFSMFSLYCIPPLNRSPLTGTF